MNRPAQRLNGLLLLSGVLALSLMLAGCGGGGGGSTASAPPPVVPGNVPQNVSATPRAGSITVTWSPVTGATSYNVYWSALPGVTKGTGNRVDNVASPYVHRGLRAGDTRYYVVASVSGVSAEGPESAEVSATVTVSLQPGPDVGQYFDRAIQASGPQNYNDRSSHPLRGLTTPDNALLFGGENCLDCHYVSGPPRTSDECLKCHFEDQPNAPAGNHMNGVLELATVTNDNLPTTRYTISSIQNYDDWCMQCHGATTIGLGGQTPSASAKTLLDPAAFSNGRHRANAVGCIHCHQPHGRSNAKTVRENPSNRLAAGATPRRFNVFPSDNLGPGENAAFRARPYWADNTLPYVAEADDDQSYCNRTCHIGTFSQRKDKVLMRDEVTGNYSFGIANRKIYVVNGIKFTIDNLTLVPGYRGIHGHVDGEIIPTDDMVRDYAALIGLSGPSYYQYPQTANSHPSAYSPATSSLPFSPDYPDNVRDFTNAYNGFGVRIAYRFTCSTCHTPHGTALANTPGAIAYPDLRLPGKGSSELCDQCHR